MLLIQANWGCLFTKLWLIRLGIPHCHLELNPLSRGYTFKDEFKQRLANVYNQGLDFNPGGHCRAVGGDQSRGICNTRID